MIVLYIYTKPFTLIVGIMVVQGEFPLTVCGRHHQKNKACVCKDEVSL